jgi:hypothetical protein
MARLTVAPNERTLLHAWRSRAKLVQTAHFETASSLEKQHWRISVPTVILTTVVGTSMFATLQDSPNRTIKMLIGFASVAAAVLAALQSGLKLQERAQMHRISGNKYGGLKREIEQAMTFHAEATEEFVTNLRLRWNQLVEECPVIPQRVWNRVAGPNADAWRKAEKELESEAGV